MSDEHGNGWDDFDWNSWGTNGDDTSARDGANGRTRQESADDGESDVGHWVTSGGILRWEESDEDEESGPRDLRAEADSTWADDAIELPLGAPPRLRLRAMRAWLARQRLLEQEAQGMVLLERRERQADEDDEEPQSADVADPFTLELAEHQAAATEFERMLEVLADLENHSGLDRVLVEFYLWLGDRIATLAQAPEAPEQFRAAAFIAEPEPSGSPRAVTPLTHAEWHGQAESVLAARRHAERITIPEPEE